jgi:Domain of unknown function (DUF5666)
MSKAIRLCLIGAATLLVSASAAFAQQPTRVRGTIEKVDGSTLTVRAGEADEVKLNLTGGAQVYGVVKASLADVQPGAFVGVGAMPQADGSQKAIQIMIFPEAMRGVGEGHRPWDRPGSTMTNGTVDATVGAVNGQTFTVKYKDGEKKIVVVPDSVIRTYVTGSRDELKPGAHVAAFAVKKPDGTLEAPRINVGREGIEP